MAISRVPGFSLLPNLDRQGIDLEFTTQGNTLVYMDFANFQFGINTDTPQESLEVNGNVLVSNGSVLTSGNLSYNLGSSTNWWNTLFVGNITAGNFVAGNVDGVLTTSTQPYITSLGTLVGLDINGNLTVANQLRPTSNSSGTIGNASLWWGTIYANVINSPNINGTILTANQPFITNLGNISVNSITIGGNISISGNTNGGVINADELYEANYRVLTTNTTITVNGDVTGLGTYTNVYVDLINSGISANTYGSNVFVPQITFDSKGRATSATNLTLEQVGNVSVVDNTITSLSGDLNFASNVSNLSVSGTILANQITADQLTVASADIGGAEILTTNSNIVVGGDVVGYGTNANVYVGLTTTGVSPGTYGSSNQVPQIVVDDKGRVTYAANIAITSNIGNLAVSDTTISSLSGITLSANANVNITTTGNIVLDAGGYGVVIMQGTDAFQMPSGNTANRPGYPAIGYTRFNTEVGSIEYWDGTNWTVPGFSTITSETIYPDGNANTYVLTSNTTTYSVFVSINGTVQQPVVAYNVVNDNQIVFTEVPAVTDVIEVRHFAAGVTVTALVYGNTRVETNATDVEVTGNLVPATTDTYNLGNATHKWDTLNAEQVVTTGNITTSSNLKFTNWSVYEANDKLYFAHNNIVKMSLDNGGNIIITGNITPFGTP